MDACAPPRASPVQPGHTACLCRLVYAAWYSSVDCSGAELGYAPSGIMYSQTSTRIAVSGSVAPSPARSALFLLVASGYGDSGIPVGMEFDNAFFGPGGAVPVQLESFTIE